MRENRCLQLFSTASLITPCLLTICLIVLAGCSSAPKRPSEIFTARNAASGQLDLGNQAVSKGDYETAHLFLREAWRLAVSADDPEMRIKILLAEGNAWFNEGNREKALETWTAAQNEAVENNNTTLISLGKIYQARFSLEEGNAETKLTPAERKEKALKAKTLTQTEMENVRSNPLYTAFSWKVIGLADKELENWTASEEALKKAADIHAKNQYLEDAAYDWYLIASVRSKAGQYPAALEALNSAIGFDRRAENANGLGMDWMAMGMIEEKQGNKEKAAAAYNRAADIFTSVSLSKNASDAELRLKSVTSTK